MVHNAWCCLDTQLSIIIRDNYNALTELDQCSQGSFLSLSSTSPVNPLRVRDQGANSPEPPARPLPLFRLATRHEDRVDS